VAQAQVAGYIVPMSLREAREESPEAYRIKIADRAPDYRTAKRRKDPFYNC
jgi:hypothetical protein